MYVTLSTYSLEAYGKGKIAAAIAGGVGALIGGAKLFQMYKEKKEARREAGAMQCYKQVCRWIATSSNSAIKAQNASIKRLQNELPKLKEKLKVQKDKLNQMEAGLKGFGGMMAEIADGFQKSKRDAHNKKVKDEIFRAKVNGTQYTGGSYDESKTDLEVYKEKVQAQKDKVRNLQNRIDSIPEWIDEYKNNIDELKSIADDAKESESEEVTLSNAKAVLNKSAKLLKIWARADKSEAKSASKELERLLK